MHFYVSLSHTSQRSDFRAAGARLFRDPSQRLHLWRPSGCNSGIRWDQLFFKNKDWLVHLKNMKVNWDDEIPNIWENKKWQTKPPTRTSFKIKPDDKRSLDPKWSFYIWGNFWWVSWTGATAIAECCIMEDPMKMDDLGFPPFQESSIHWIPCTPHPANHDIWHLVSISSVLWLSAWVNWGKSLNLQSALCLFPFEDPSWESIFPRIIRLGFWSPL